MPAREGAAMKLFATALFSLAVLSLCCSGAEGSAVATSPSQPPGPTSSRSSLTRTTISTPTPTGNTSATKHATTIEGSRENSTSQTTPIPKESLTTSNRSTARAATSAPSLRSESPVTATPNSTLSTTDQSDNSTTRNPASSNATLSPVAKVPQSTANSTTPIKGDAGNSEHKQDTSSHFNIILPVIIALLVITLSVFLLVTVYRMCWKTTPERQENGTEQTPSDKENVKLISVKTASPEAGEHSSQGKNKTRQHDDSSLRLGSKCV